MIAVLRMHRLRMATTANKEKFTEKPLHELREQYKTEVGKKFLQTAILDSHFAASCYDPALEASMPWPSNLQNSADGPIPKIPRILKCGSTKFMSARTSPATVLEITCHGGCIYTAAEITYPGIQGGKKTVMGSRTSSAAIARSKAERASVVEVLEGKAAGSFSKTAVAGTEEKLPKPKVRKDWVRAALLSVSSYCCCHVQELTMEAKAKKDFQKDHAA